MRNLSRQISWSWTLKCCRAEEMKESRAARRNSDDIDGGVSRDLAGGNQTHSRHCSPLDVEFEKHVKERAKQMIGEMR